MEALKYFRNKKAEFASNRFNHKEAKSFCKQLYKFGAIYVDVPYEKSIDDCEVYADTLIITLPKSLSKRLDILSSIMYAMPDEISSNTQYIKKVDWKKDNSVLLWWD